MSSTPSRWSVVTETLPHSYTYFPPDTVSLAITSWAVAKETLPLPNWIMSPSRDVKSVISSLPSPDWNTNVSAPSPPASSSFPEPP